MNGVLMIRIVLGIILLLVFLFIIRLIRGFVIEKRIANYTLSPMEENNVSLFDQISAKYLHFLSKFSKNSHLIHYANRYNQKGIVDSKDAVIFILNKLIIAVIFVGLIIVSFAIQGKNLGIIGFLFSFVIGYYLYDIYMIWNKKKRSKKIKNDMLRAVIIMNNAFKAGKSTLQAVDIASRDLPKPISLEFRKIYQDMNYGISAEVAFSRFSSRVSLDEANYIATSLTILNKTGGNIVAVFSSIERTLFDKKKLESDLKNSTAASSLVVKVLMVIPILFVMVIYVISPSYFAPLFTSGLGYFILSIIILMFVIYIYLLNKIMKVRV